MASDKDAALELIEKARHRDALYQTPFTQRELRTIRHSLQSLLSVAINYPEIYTEHEMGTILVQDIAFALNKVAECTSVNGKTIDEEPKNPFKFVGPV